MEHIEMLNVSQGRNTSPQLVCINKDISEFGSCLFWWWFLALDMILFSLANFLHSARNCCSHANFHSAIYHCSHKHLTCTQQDIAVVIQTCPEQCITEVIKTYLHWARYCCNHANVYLELQQCTCALIVTAVEYIIHDKYILAIISVYGKLYTLLWIGSSCLQIAWICSCSSSTCMRI